MGKDLVKENEYFYSFCYMSLYCFLVELFYNVVSFLGILVEVFEII